MAVISGRQHGLAKQNEMEITKNIQTENGMSEFQIRLLKNEGVGLLTTRQNDSYFILDSSDYWYDLIQDNYPRKQKCSCKNEWFRVQFQFFIRDNSEDIREVLINTTCTNCEKKSTRETIDIDYSPTNKLIENQITYVKKPDIRYKYEELTAFWIKSDLNSFLHFLIKELNLNAYCWYFKQPENIRAFETVTLGTAIEIGEKFLGFYFTNEKLQIKDLIKFEDEQGVYIDRNLWRKRKIIKLSSCNIYEIGPLYYITFCNQYIDKEEVHDKSAQFETNTNELKNWLKENFINKRGKTSFDGKEGYQKYLDKRKM